MGRKRNKRRKIKARDKEGKRKEKEDEPLDWHFWQRHIFQRLRCVNKNRDTSSYAQLILTANSRLRLNSTQFNSTVATVGDNKNDVIIIGR